jgi:hypothetical protein
MKDAIEKVCFDRLDLSVFLGRLAAGPPILTRGGIGESNAHPTGARYSARCRMAHDPLGPVTNRSTQEKVASCVFADETVDFVIHAREPNLYSL